MARRLPESSKAALAAAGLLFAAASFAAGGGARHVVAMDGTRFEPESLTVKAGDTVVWVNRDPFPHTSTAQSGSFDSKSIGAGKSWKYRAMRKGDFPYFCAFHPTMKGFLRVE